MIKEENPLTIGKLYCYRNRNSDKYDFEYIFVALTSKPPKEMNSFYLIKHPHKREIVKKSWLTDLSCWHEF